MNGRTLYVRGQEQPVYLPLRMPAMPNIPARMRSSLNRFNCLSVLWTALHLVEEDQRILISVAQEPVILRDRGLRGRAIDGGGVVGRGRDRKSTRLNPVTHAHLVCRLL